MENSERGFIPDLITLMNKASRFLRCLNLELYVCTIDICIYMSVLILYFKKEKIISHLIFLYEPMFCCIEFQMDELGIGLSEKSERLDLTFPSKWFTV